MYPKSTKHMCLCSIGICPKVQHFCNNKECQLKNMFQLLHKAPNYATSATSTTRGTQLRRVCNNKECQLEYTLQLLHKAPNYATFATTTTWGIQLRLLQQQGVSIEKGAGRMVPGPLGYLATLILTPYFYEWPLAPGPLPWSPALRVTAPL